MDYRDNADEAAFRQKLRGWLTETSVADWRDAPTISEARKLWGQWVSALNDGGFLGLTWPIEEGGQGLSQVYNVILNQEVGAFDCPPYPPQINLFGRMIAAFGNEHQRDRFLAPTFSGDIFWCQGFSEPGAGSDLAGLTTTARLDGDEWVINGQKLWTTMAVYADWCFLLARTDPNSTRHHGISAFVADLKSPGVTVSPIDLANGDPEAAEVFWENVRVPADQILGQPGDGWRIAMSTFAYERNPAEMEVVAELWQWLREAEQLAAELGRLSDPAIRRRLADVRTRIEGLTYVSFEQLSSRIDAGLTVPGEESSVGKLLWTWAGQELQHVVLDILGPVALSDSSRDPMTRYIWSRVLSVYGGSAQIQKNILARRVLGLPGA